MIPWHLVIPCFMYQYVLYYNWYSGLGRPTAPSSFFFIDSCFYEYQVFGVKLKGLTGCSQALVLFLFPLYYPPRGGVKTCVSFIDVTIS